MQVKLLLRVLLVSCLLLPLGSHAQFDPNHVYTLSLRNAVAAPLEAIGGDHNADQPIRIVDDYDHYSYQGPVLSWQEWKFINAGNGYVRIINRHSNKFLTSSRDYNNNRFGYVSQLPYNGTDSQLWRPELQSSGDYRFSDTNGYFLEGSNQQGGVDADQSRNFFFQNIRRSNGPYAATHGGVDFAVTDASLNPASGVFTLATNNNGKVLAQDTDNNQVGQKDGLGTADQQWSFGQYGSSVVIVSRATQKVLTVNGTSNNSYVTAEKNTLSYNQTWVLRDANDYHVLTITEATDGRIIKIQSPYSGKTLGYQDGGQNEGQLATVYQDFSYPWQQWRVVGGATTPNLTGPTPSEMTSATNTKGSVSLTSAVAAEQAKAEQETAKAAAGTTSLFGVYPNPARDDLTISLPGAATPTAVQVYDIKGQLVDVSYLGDGKISVATLASGLYLLRVRDKQQEYHQRFTKE